MPRQKKAPSANTKTSIEDDLNGLFGALGDAIDDMVSRLEEGNAGVVSRDQVFETSKGPVRARAGVRLRMGGLDTGVAPADRPQPINPDRAKPAKAAAESRPLSYELFEDQADWILTADMPGVRSKELEVLQDETTLVIKTTGLRRYDAHVALNAPFRLEDITTTLRNGILTLQIKKADTA